MDAYLTVIANRTNEIMKVLTIFSALMLPLTLVAGIYGMNFRHMPEIEWLYGYPFAIGLMVFIAFSMLAIFWVRGWINWPRKGDWKSSGPVESRTIAPAGQRSIQNGKRLSTRHLQLPSNTPKVPLDSLRPKAVLLALA